MTVEDVVSVFLADYGDITADILVFGAQAFAAGALACVIAWAIGFAVHGAYRWLEESSDTRERRL